MRLLSVLFSIALATVPALRTAVAQDNHAPIIPGFSHTPFSDSDTGDGIALPGGDVTYSSPVIAELNGDDSDGKEVIIASADGIVAAYQADGSLLWQSETPNASCSGASKTNKLLSSPAVGELYGDGTSYVVVGYGGVGGKKCDGGVIAFRGTDGAVEWTFSLKKFSSQEKFGTLSYTVFSSPALADTDNDGKLEIGFGSFDRNVYLLEANGSVRWYYNAADTIWSSPAFADVDGKAGLEMIIGTDISANSKIRPITRNGGFVYALKTTKRSNKHIYFRQPDAIVWKRSFDQVIHSSPVVADVLDSNPGQEIIVASGCFFPQDSTNKKGKWVKILRKSDGKVLQTLPTVGCSSSSVAVGDLDDDGTLEVVASISGHRSIGGDGDSHLVAWKAANTTPIWSITPTYRGSNDAFGGNFISPTIADLDGNGSHEVIVGNLYAVHIFNGIDGSALTCQDRSCDEDQKLLFTSDAVRSTPAIGDLNDDGFLDLVIGAGHSTARGQGVLYGWSFFETFLESSNGAQPSQAIGTSMFRMNAQHTGSVE